MYTQPSWWQEMWHRIGLLLNPPDTRKPPGCFGSQPSSQMQAESDCHTCRCKCECLAHNNEHNRATRSVPLNATVGAERIEMNALEDVAETVREIAKRDREIERLRAALTAIWDKYRAAGSPHEPTLGLAGMLAYMAKDALTPDAQGNRLAAREPKRER